MSEYSGAVKADETVSYTLDVNGTSYDVVDVPYFESLLNVLRDQLGLRGTKYSCDEGQCGACTVQIDGKAINSCIEPAVEAIGCSVQTIEGHSYDTGEPTDLQEALMRGGDVQCGYCMPGIVMSADALLLENPNRSEEEIREGMSGNLCRCTGYSKILKAVGEVAKSRSEHARD
ncbi:MAG: (2Fe-2S)-binding protein [Actinobacteria bacterium]|nr:(2Fe-2S)-binding protein [Actinomycetota bacterium]